MTVVNFNQVSKTFGDKVVLKEVSFSIHPQERVGLVGPNGAGKSTIFKILMGELVPDDGSFEVERGIEIGYLSQSLQHVDDYSIEAYFMETQKVVRNLQIRMNLLAEQMAELAGESLEKVIAEYGDLCSRFELRGGYELDYRTELVLEGLGLSHLEKTRRLGTLSGGQKTRVGLAALLISSPDLLLLDEPTNHLDIETLDWLEGYLTTYKGTLVVISHDRKFLNQTVTKVLELDEYSHRTTEYTGNYDAYITGKRKNRERWAQAYQQQQDEIERLKERIIDAVVQAGHNRPMKDNNKMAYNKAGHNVQVSVSRNIRAAQKQLDRIMENPVPRPPESMQFSPEFDPARIENKLAMIVSGLSVTTPNGDSRLIENVNFTLGNQGRMLIVGPNGSGKTTLFQMLVGKQKPVEGSIYVVPQIKLGFLEQEVHYQDTKATVLEEFTQGKEGHRDEHVAVLLSYQLFQYEEMLLPVRALSPGQHRKLQLAKLMYSGANMLLIDEPTNHLSFDILEEFEGALQRFPGPVIVVSHDRWFIERFCGEVWRIEGKKLVPPALTKRFTEQEEDTLIAQIQELSAYAVDGNKTMDMSTLLNR